MKSMNLFCSIFCLVVVLFHIEGTASLQIGYGPFVKHVKQHVPSDEIPGNVVNGDIIDLDGGDFDLALTDGPYASPSKHAEDMREMRTDGGEPLGTYGGGDNVVIGHDDGEIFTPVPLMMESLHDARNDSDGGAFVTDDEDDGVDEVEADEELQGSGSGSGAIVIEIEDATGKYNSTRLKGKNNQTDGVHVEMVVSRDSTKTKAAKNLATDLFQDFMQDNHVGILTTTESHDLPPYCEEPTNITWTSWSPWIQAGDVDFRFRHCPAAKGFKTNLKQCEGDFFETRKCNRRDETVCRTGSGDITEQFNVGCSGIKLDDVKSIEEIRNPYDRKDDCEYTLYDMTYNMPIGEPITTDTLMTSDPHMWCLADDKFVAFHTPTQKCLDNLKSFCKSAQTCKYGGQKKKIKNKGDLHKDCWKEFVFGSTLPAGIPDNGGNQMICQRFSKDSQLGKTLSSKKAHFATLYDAKRRMPIVSMVNVRNMGDEKWPRVPYMIERGLINEDSSSVVSWFFKDKKKGIVRPDEISSDCGLPACTYGERQALEQDYVYSGYRIAHLLPPELVGADIGARLATFTMTNTAPMEPTIYAKWQNAIRMVRRFAIDECHLQKQFPKGPDRRTDGHELPELYLMAGTAAVKNHMEVMGNDVVVPDVFWMTACCVQGANVSSFAVYTYNQFEQHPTVMSISNLHILLQSEFYGNIEEITVNLYPAFNGLCSALENDISYRKQIL